MVVSKLRLPLIDLDQLFEVVRPCTIVDSDRLLDAIQMKTTSTNIRYRGVLCTFKNISKPETNEDFKNEIICLNLFQARTKM